VTTPSDLVAKAKRNGLLVPGPCEVCGTNKNIEGHHDDYSKPLSVRWLCRRHHAQHHALVKKQTEPKTENIKLRIDSELKAELERLALLGDRNLAQEMRRALRAYVQAQKDGAE